ncbi:MAG: FtsX-like permease family protein, partial [Acidobacteriota bacterium]
AARSPEVAIRTSLGADRGRLLRQFLTESSLLALLGGALGVGLAFYGVRLLGSALPEALFRVGALSVDATALAFTLTLSLATAVLFGLAPALRGAKVDLSQTLKEGGRSVEGGRRGRRLRGFLVVAQLSLAVVLLSGAFMMIGTASRLQSFDLGFDPDDVLTLRLSLPDADYDTREKRVTFFDQLTQRLEGLPGIDSAAAVGPLPLSFSTYGVEFEIPGHQPASADERLGAHYITATPHYFDAMGIPLRRGRAFDERDTTESAGVVVINEIMAERFWPGEDVLGRSLQLKLSADRVRPVTVIGVVGRVRDAPEWQGEGRGEQLYVPWAQAPRRGGHVVVRSAGSDPQALIPQVREELRRLDANLPVSELWTMNEVLAYSVQPIETASRMLSGFALVAILLAVVGIYGVVAYTTSRRQHELGIRLALGAGRGSVLWLVLWQGAALTAIGVGLGLGVSFALGQVLASQMPGIIGPGIESLAIVTLILGAAALGASYFPAQRAAQMDPLKAIRYE